MEIAYNRHKNHTHLQLLTKCLFSEVFVNVSHLTRANVQTRNYKRVCLANAQKK